MRRRRPAGIERRKIFRGLVVQHLRMIENNRRNDSRLHRDQSRRTHNQHKNNRMAAHRSPESAPPESLLHEDIGPEFARSRLQRNRRDLPRAQQVAQVAQKHMSARREFDQQPQGRGGRALKVDRGLAGRHLLILDANQLLRIAGGTQRDLRFQGRCLDFRLSPPRFPRSTIYNQWFHRNPKSRL